MNVGLRMRLQAPQPVASCSHAASARWSPSRRPKRRADLARRCEALAEVEEVRPFPLSPSHL